MSCTIGNPINGNGFSLYRRLEGTLDLFSNSNTWNIRGQSEAGMMIVWVSSSNLLNRP